MPRRRRKKSLVPTTWMDWTPTFASLFRLVPTGWKPPAKVRASHARSHVTYTARFTDPEGMPSKALVRVKRDVAGELYVADETLSMSLRTAPAAGPAS